MPRVANVLLIAKPMLAEELRVKFDSGSVQLVQVTRTITSASQSLTFRQLARAILTVDCSESIAAKTVTPATSIDQATVRTGKATPSPVTSNTSAAYTAARRSLTRFRLQTGPVVSRIPTSKAPRPVVLSTLRVRQTEAVVAARSRVLVSLTS